GQGRRKKILAANASSPLRSIISRAANRPFWLVREGGQKGAALPDLFPGHIQVVAFEGSHFGVNRVGILHLGQRRVKSIFVAADVVFVAETAGRNLDKVAGLD